jgi:hypothetical protein
VFTGTAGAGAGTASSLPISGSSVTGIQWSTATPIAYSSLSYWAG